MSRKHYKRFAVTMGDGLAIAKLNGGESARTEFYNEVYCPFVAMLAEDNPRFSREVFSFAAAEAEAKYLDAAAECGREANNG